MSTLLCINTAMAQTSDPVVSVVFAGDIMLEGGPDRAIRRDRDPFAGTPWHKYVPVHLERLVQN
jgi:hypothetical protein